MSALCRDCGATCPVPSQGHCPECGGRRLVAHPELEDLAVAHVDCDAFYASVEKRDRPWFADQPLIIGGGKRGVVAACCYVARMYGVHSAMPMFKALKACPDAVVLPPDMAKYGTVGRQIRHMMREITPLVEPISIDEAFLDLSGTQALHRGCPARTLILLARRIERELGLTVSIGLSCNKFLAKVASDLDKPRGFVAIGSDEALRFLEHRPVAIIPGVGKVLQEALARDGITKIGQLWAHGEAELTAWYGSMGSRLYNLSRARDDRRVSADAPAKSISAETTFETDIAEQCILLARLWPLCEIVGRRLKGAGLAAGIVTLKLKTSNFRILTRSRRLSHPTRLAEAIFRAAEPLLREEAKGRRYRLIGIGAGQLTDAAHADPPDLLGRAGSHHARIEEVIDAVRAKLGESAITKGRALAGATAPDRAPRRGRR